MSALPPFNTIPPHREPRRLRFVNDMQDALDETAPPLGRGLDEGARWYAVHTLPHGELRAEEQLENQGFRTFLP